MTDVSALRDHLITLHKQIEQKAHERKNEKPQENKFDFTSIEVLNAGKEIVLPEGMGKEEAIDCLQRLIIADQEQVAVEEMVICHPYEGSYALMQVLRAIYGWFNPVPTPGFFGPKPPRFLSYEVALGRQEQIIWGKFQIPGVNGTLETSYAFDKNRPVFCLKGIVRKRFLPDVQKIAEALRLFIRENSVYHHKAIRIESDANGNIGWENPPKFMDTRSTNVNSLIFSEETLRHVRTHIFAPIEKTDACRAAGIPIKRTVLLEGPFGTGKTLTAAVTARKVEDGRKWTFIYLDKVEALKDALYFARAYQPCVIFAEDCDRAISGERDAKLDDILNTIDGIDTKGDEIFTILTSNNVHSIEKAMIRPGRFDAIIHVGPPDAKAAEKLVRHYAGSYLPLAEDLTLVGLALTGKIPATIAEVVKRAKIYMVDTTKEGEELRLKADDLFDAAQSMKAHMDLLNEEGKHETPAERFADAFRDIMEADQTQKLLGEIHQQLH